MPRLAEFHSKWAQHPGKATGIQEQFEPCIPEPRDQKLVRGTQLTGQGWTPNSNHAVPVHHCHLVLTVFFTQDPTMRCVHPEI